MSDDDDFQKLLDDLDEKEILLQILTQLKGIRSGVGFICFVQFLIVVSWVVSGLVLWYYW